MDKYKRILIKISGESLSGEGKNGFDVPSIEQIASEIVEIQKLGVSVCIVIGGGNIIRGATMQESGVDRVIADHMGMMSTIINSVLLKNFLEKHSGVESRVMSALPISDVCEPYIHKKALRHLNKDRIVIFAAGTGNPYFSTDTASILRAIEMKCDIIFKGTKTDGVYSADPKKDKNATKYSQITYNKVLEENLKIMDASAVALARDNRMEIVVFSILQKNNLLSIIKEESNNYTYIN